MIDIIALSNDKKYYIKNVTDDINLSSDMSTLGAELTLKTMDKKFTEGDILILKSDKKEIFRGIIIDSNSDGIPSPNNVSTYSYNAFDFAFYLNKNQVFYKFKKKSASSCIKKLLSDFKIPIGKIADISYQISKIYNGNTVSDVIKDILEQVKEKTGKKYYFEMVQGKFNLININSLSAQYEVNSKTIISGPSHKRSIQNLKNSIVITDNSEKGKILHTVKSNSSISKYGKLQLVQSVDDKEKKRKKTIANNLLKENNKVEDKLNFDVIGSFNLIPARIIKVNLKNIKGNYRITSTKHTITSNLHVTSLELERI